MQHRRHEILAKRAKLAELKRQRELRASQATARQSIGPGEVGFFAIWLSLSAELTVIPQGALATIPAGPKDGTLVRDAQSGRLYLAHCGGFYWIFEGAMLEQVLASGLASGTALTVAGLPREAAAGDPEKCGGVGG